MIKTKKSIRSSKGPEDGTRILITRYVPRYIKKEEQKDHWDKWLIDLSPSRALHKQYKNGKISWDVFSQRFRDELRNNEKSMELCRQLAKKVLIKISHCYVLRTTSAYVIGPLLEKSVSK
jgi:uncharacterized protein YeaO (DUF488 family)